MTMKMPKNYHIPIQRLIINVMKMLEEHNIHIFIITFIVMMKTKEKSDI